WGARWVWARRAAPGARPARGGGRCWRRSAGAGMKAGGLAAISAALAPPGLLLQGGGGAAACGGGPEGVSRDIAVGTRVARRALRKAHAAPLPTNRPIHGDARTYYFLECDQR